MLFATAVGEGVGLGVALGVGVGVTVGVGVGEGVGVTVGVGVTGAGVFSFAPGNVTMNRVVPGKYVAASIVNTSLATSPKYSLYTAPLPNSKTRIVTFASALRILIRPSASEHPDPRNCGINVRE